MKTFRKIMQSRLGRFVTSGLIASTLHVSADPSMYLSVVHQQRQREEQIRAIAAKMNVDPEFLLNPQGRTKFDWRKLFSFSDEAVVTNDQPLEIREAVKRVKDRYALVAADTVLARIAQLSQISLEGKNKGQVRAELQSVLRLIDKDFLPAVKDEASGVAKSRDNEMRRELKDLRQRVKSVINAPHALDEANLESTVTNLRAAINGTISVRHSKPRWTRDPFPVKDTYRFANIKPAGPSYDENGTGSNATTPAIVSQSTETPSAAKLRPVSTATSAEVTSLANSLGTPAKIFAWVHDNIDWDSYSGVAKGSLGTLQERRGNDWDQAMLLRDLLAARGYDARLEWGRVTLPIAKAMNLVGTEDPLQAANLLATAGFDGLVLTSKNQPVAVQMTHAWVRSFIPYVPNRGATAGTPDTWVRMDPSFKRYEYQQGIAINGKVNWSEDEYLQTSAIRPPAEFYGDKIWNYIRTSNIDCVNLSQVTKAGRITATNYPFVPATLTTKIDSVAGVAQTPPTELMQSVTMTVTDINGAVMSSYTTSLADVWGKKLSITFPPATADDAATIAAYGGLFNTPAYLIKLKPVFSLDDVPVADGSPVAAGAVLDLNTTFRQPNVADDFTHHEVVAGETHAVVLDPGMFPDSLLESRINRLKTLTNEDAQLSEKLYLVGLRYMQHVDDGISFAAGVRWQRPVKRVFEADVRRQIDITYNVAGAAVRLTPAENNIDVSRLLVGIVPINNDLTNRASALALAGLQSSYLEGAIWEEMESQQGISAAKALLLARMSGQQLYTVNASNVNTVLNTVNLSSDVEAEIRSAVGQGRIAKIPSANITLGRWTGTGYILQDPQTGAATYPISGGLAGGSSTDEDIYGLPDVYGLEEWLAASPFGMLIDMLAPHGGTPINDYSDDKPSTMQSDPVNIATGNMYRNATDIYVAAQSIPIAITRAYNSRSNHNGTFGYGWTFCYDESITENADGSATYRDADGTEHLFTRNADGSFNAPTGKWLTLTGSAGGWTLDLKEGARFTFDSAGRSTSHRDLNGNTVTITRNAQGLPATIIDDSGRTVLTFTTAQGRITRVTDLGGRTVNYEYNGDDLVRVTDAAGKVWTFTYDLNHNLTQFTDPTGRTQSYDYDTDDRLFHHVDANGAEEFFQYDIAGRQSVVTDRLGGDRLIGYDDRGRPTMQVDQAGNRALATWNDDNTVAANIDSRGNTSSYAYDDDGDLTRETRPDGTTAVATYDSFGRPLTETDFSGMTTSYSYTGGNVTRVETTINGVQQVTTMTYDGDGNMLTSTDAAGHTTTMTYDSNGVIATRTDATNRTTTFTTDSLGRITSMKDPAQNETKLTYDIRDRIVATIDPHGITTTVEYDDAGRRLAVTDPKGTMRFTYDGEGRVVSMTDRAGVKTATTYDANGNVIAVSDGRGNVNRYDYDAVGRIMKFTDATGAVWTYGYCAALATTSSCSSCSGGGNDSAFCEITDPNGRTLKREFDNLGRLVSITGPKGEKSFVQYDAAGRQKLVTDANGNATAFVHDAAGRLLSVTDAMGGVTSYTYDVTGRRLTRKDPNGNVWKTVYDDAGRVLEQTDPLQRKTTLTYDPAGRLATKTDGNNKTTTFSWTADWLTKITYADGTADNFSYDAVGRRVGMSNANVSLAYAYDANGRLATLTNQTYGLTIGYEYDAAGNWTKVTTPRSTTQYSYDAKNRVTAMTDSLFGTFRFAYDGLDRRTELRYPNGLTTNYAYDEYSRVTTMVTKDQLGAVQDAWSYAYDAVGVRTSKTDMSGAAEIYRFDRAYRLTEVDYANGKLEKFAYDPAGNRTRRTDETGTSTIYSYDVANQLVVSGADTFTYDGNGAMTKRTAAAGNTTIAYDLAGRATGIVSPQGSETNLYAPDGTRVDMAGASIENGRVRVLNDATAHPILDWGTDNQVWTYRLYGPQVDEVLAEYRRVNNRTTYLHRDDLKSVTLVTDTTGKPIYRSSYSAFGTMSRSSDPSGIPQTRLGYTGREISVGSLMNYRARYYDTSVGRFTAQDSYTGEATNPASQNRYTYVQNNPVQFTDPTGMFCANPSGERFDWELNRWKPNWPIPHPLAPGICNYKGLYAQNFYVNFKGHWLHISPFGKGWLHAPYLSYKEIPWGPVGAGNTGYMNGSPYPNRHIGLWSNANLVCFVVDDGPDDEYGMHWRFCIPKWVFVLVVVIILIVAILMLTGGIGIFPVPIPVPA